MVDKKIFWFFALALIVAVVLLTAVNWLFIPEWQYTPGGIWKILGNSIGYASIFFAGLIAALNTLGLLGVTKKKDVESPSFLHQLPELENSFFGRTQQLQSLKEMHTSKKVNAFGIVGMGGIGKTMLALAFAQTIANKCYAEIFLDMRGVESNPVNSEEAMLHVIRSFHPSFGETENVSLIVGAYRSIFHNRRILVFFDNVKDEEQIKNLLPPKTSVMIFTSRQGFLLPDCHTFLVPLMSTLESQQFLLKMADRLTKDESDKIAELCGYLPNALSKAGRILREYLNLDVSEYIKRLSYAKNRIDLIEPTTDVSYNLLSNQLKKVWRKLSVFPEGFGMEAAQKVLEVDFENCEQMLFNLNKVSMLSAYRSRPSVIQGEEQVEIRFRLHDLDRVFADSKLEVGERQKVYLKFAEYYSGVLKFAGRLYENGGPNSLFALDVFDREWGNIEHGQNISSKYRNKSDRMADLCVDFSLNAAGLLDLRVSNRKIIEWSNAALEIARGKKDLVAEGIALNNLGTAYSDLGDFDVATPLLERSLDIAEKTKNKFYLFARVANLGNLLRRKGDLRLSLSHHNRAYAIAGELKNRSFQTQELINIGNVYLDMGEKEEALEKHLLGLNEAKSLENKFIETKALLTLARDYETIGSRLMALKYYRASLFSARTLGAREIEVEVIKLYKDSLDSIGLGLLGRIFLR